jgi:hypothetical protein
MRKINLHFCSHPLVPKISPSVNLASLLAPQKPLPLSGLRYTGNWELSQYSFPRSAHPEKP